MEGMKIRRITAIAASLITVITLAGCANVNVNVKTDTATSEQDNKNGADEFLSDHYHGGSSLSRLTNDKIPDRKAGIGVKKTYESDFGRYYELDDGTWSYDGRNYKYRLEIAGRMNNAAEDSTFIYLSNIEDIPFDRAVMASGLGSNTADYFSPEEAVFVGWLSPSEEPNEADHDAKVKKEEEQEMTFMRDGKTIYGELYTPKGEGPFPAVILGHQFGANHSTMEGYAKAFVRNGIMACVFDFIGGGHNIKSDGTMEEMSVLTEAADMSTVLDQIRALDNVDKDNVFLMGASQGGFVATYVAGMRPNDVRGLIAFYPAYVIQDDAKKRTGNGTNLKDSFTVLGAKLGRIYDEDALSFDIYDVMKKYDGSVLIVHGTADGLVPYEYSERAAETFADAELVAIDGADHGFGGADDERATSLAVDFVTSLSENKNR